MRHLPLLLLLSSCSIFFGRQDEPKTAKGFSYSISFSKSDWIYKKDQRSDYVFENQKDGRILIANSFCEEFQDQPLEQLAERTFKTVQDFKTHKNDYMTFQNREAYQLIGQGLVDGVKVNLHLINTRRNNCYFDFVSINPNINQKPDTSFEDFLKSVVFR